MNQDLASLIDHTLLKPDATRTEVERLCAEAREHQFAGVCVYSGWVPLCVERLAGSRVGVCTVAGFPHGAHHTEVKAFETARAIELGASEIDVVLAIGLIKSGDFAGAESDLRAVVKVAGARARIKAILETALLTRDEKVAAAKLARAAGAAFVKTSTGFAGGGATAEDVRLLRMTVGPAMGIKASGGIRTAQDALAMIRAGATRIGTSAGVAILAEARTGTGARS
ncbi:MAG: deoxyribose-phosphate aldolase [Candidatus Eiseniibacteriota bacterium]